MKVGDLVKCTFQPATSRIENGIAVRMEYKIKGELGIITKVRSNGIHNVLFPRFGYEHELSASGFEVINESW